jgi:hypothetical protein
MATVTANPTTHTRMRYTQEGTNKDETVRLCLCRSMTLDHTTSATERARRKLIDTMIFKLLIWHFGQRYSHKISIDTSQDCNVANNHNTTSLSLKFYLDQKKENHSALVDSTNRE